MAHVSIAAPARGFSLTNMVYRAVDAFKDLRDRRAVYLRTEKELDALSDRMLTDLGISRADIPEIARQEVQRVFG
jgi:uncharacterized protein YjiS (DUF1127 family)